MLKFLPYKIKGVISSLLLTLNVIFWVAILFVVSLLKFLLPIPPWHRFINDRILPWIAENWISGNSGWMKLTQKTKWDVQGLERAKLQQMVSCCRQPPVLGGYFRGAAFVEPAHPPAEIFLKRQLI